MRRASVQVNTCGSRSSALLCAVTSADHLVAERRDLRDGVFGLGAEDCDIQSAFGVQELSELDE